MTPEMVMSLGFQSMKMTLLVAAPMLLAALSVGLLVSLFQAATQINEMTLSFIPKILAVIGTMILAGPWILGLLADYTRELFQRIPLLVS
ncbi:flagellar biosynthesis protein FliQ [Halotalea alkalilenta]|uniref:Flagellar biosynthetic protein FliQ n=1 Tax=Halotalea alkalilenta TaxID=376489 RepID=A0A172YGM5_9GAMM|nr:flagellar biosynthesis protein FliQ [Halotalea alkalilenta]ANF58364.1 EscS/YscS/HrcS family type III secretion system export apparatus protein [Halotalea alkalilenta]